MIKRLFIALVFFLVLIFNISFTQDSKKYCSGENELFKSNGPPPCYAGEPPMNLNCTTCHTDGTLNTGSATVSLDLGLAETGYVPGNTYTVTVSLSKSGMVRSGFQSIVLKDSNSAITPGVVSLLNTSRTQTGHPHPGPCPDQGTKTWVMHTLTGTTNVSSGFNSWSYQWQAPSTDVGTVTFYTSVLESNNSLDETEDHIYTLSKTIAVDPTSVKRKQLSDQYIVYPNLNNGVFFVNSKSVNALFVSVYRSDGKLVNSLMCFTGETMIDMTNEATGMYFIQVKSEDGVVVKKILINE